MLNEEKKQKILEGAYCVTRSGKKAKWLYTSIYHTELPNLFIIIDNNRKTEYPLALNSNFRYSDKFEGYDDIIDLWDDYLNINNH